MRPKSAYYDSMFEIRGGVSRDTKEYSTYTSVLQRCKAKSKPNYMGMEIDSRYTDKVDGFKNFLDDVGLAPTTTHQIDRIKNELGYLVGNLRWVTCSQNMRNRRVTLTVLRTSGVSISAIEYCEIMGYNYLNIKQRYYRYGFTSATESEVESWRLQKIR